MRSVMPAEFQLIADCIRSDQVSHAEAVAIMSGNPDFARWYREKYPPDEHPPQAQD